MSDKTPPASTKRRIIIVTGMAGAGLNTTRSTLEDIGFEVIDNLPLPLVEQLINGDDTHPIAFGLDARARQFSAERIVRLIDSIKRRADAEVQMIFLDCDDDQLIGRFSETRRRHPLAEGRPVSDGLALERQMLEPLKMIADLHIDTSAISTTDLRHLLHGHFPATTGRGLSVQIMSFSYRQGIPREADFIYDARFITNPHYVKELRPQTGQDQAVGAYICQDPAFIAFFQGMIHGFDAMLPGFQRNDRPYLTIGFGCTGGKHRSVFMAECTAAWFSQKGYPVRLNHRELLRNGLAKPYGTSVPDLNLLLSPSPSGLQPVSAANAAGLPPHPAPSHAEQAPTSARPTPDFPARPAPRPSS